MTINRDEALAVAATHLSSVCGLLGQKELVDAILALDDGSDLDVKSTMAEETRQVALTKYQAALLWYAIQEHGGQWEYEYNTRDQAILEARTACSEAARVLVVAWPGIDVVQA